MYENKITLLFFSLLYLGLLMNDDGVDIAQDKDKRVARRKRDSSRQSNSMSASLQTTWRSYNRIYKFNNLSGEIVFVK